jgi:aryl-alcohol dehydrogenase-like predicted oxidoreductase
MTVERFELAPGHVISRVLRGGWQLDGGHGPVDRERAVQDMFAFIDSGVTTFDCADIYTGVEELIGTFRRRLSTERGAEAASRLKIHTKFVPDWDALATLDENYVRRVIDRSCDRLGVERLDLVQFHWWNYAVTGAAAAARHLATLQREGRIAHVAGTNFDTPHSAELLDAGVRVVSMQVQYSLIDSRPEHKLMTLCARSGMKLICYGVIAGGFITERWLGVKEPTEAFENRSLTKYKLVIDDFGGWDAFQELLRTLKRIADKHSVNIPAVATRWILDRPHVAGAILGARYAEHLPRNLSVFAFKLDDADRAMIEAVRIHRRGPLGDTFELERDRQGRHGRIMKYNLNAS